MINAGDAVAVLVDFQTKMAPAVHDYENLEKKTAQLIRGLRILWIPFLVTQHYTKGLGETTPAIAEALGDFEPIEKITFSCMNNETFVQKLKETGKKSVILIGIETHACIQQTALMMKEQGYRVFLPVDTTESRFTIDRDVALKRLLREGITLTTSESVYFELMQSAKHPHFKEISNILKEKAE
jgi:nicotinamidase-related amidase